MAAVARGRKSVTTFKPQIGRCCHPSRELCLDYASAERVSSCLPCHLLLPAASIINHLHFPQSNTFVILSNFDQDIDRHHEGSHFVDHRFGGWYGAGRNPQDVLEEGTTQPAVGKSLIAKGFR